MDDQTRKLVENMNIEPRFHSDAITENLGYDTSKYRRHNEEHRNGW